FLLDPLPGTEQKPAPVAVEPIVRPDTPVATMPAPSQTPAPVAAAPVAPTTPAPSATASSTSKPAATASKEYTVISGDTLSGIATNVKSDSVTQDQMLA